MSLSGAGRGNPYSSMHSWPPTGLRSPHVTVERQGDYQNERRALIQRLRSAAALLMQRNVQTADIGRDPQLIISQALDQARMTLFRDPGITCVSDDVRRALAHDITGAAGVLDPYLQVLIAERFLILERLTRKANSPSPVLLGQDHQSEKPCVIKLGAPEDEIERLLMIHEIAVHRLLSDVPGVVSLREDLIHLRGDVWACVMEWGGNDLEYCLDYLSPGDLSRIDWVVDIVRQLLAILQRIHERGVLHCDIKPQNVLLRDGKVQLSDFGIARVCNPFLLEEWKQQGVSSGFPEMPAGTTLGSPAYMASEVTHGIGYATVRSDICSLGVLFYELLTGGLPFSADTQLDTMILRATKNPPNPRSLRPDIPEPLGRLVQRWMALKPQDRPESAQVALEQLEDIVL